MRHAFRTSVLPSQIVAKILPFVKFNGKALNHVKMAIGLCQRLAGGKDS